MHSHILSFDMAVYDLLILNGIVVTDTEIGEMDIAIKDEKIAEVVPKGMLSEVRARRTIDAKRGYVMVVQSLIGIWLFDANR